MQVRVNKSEVMDIKDSVREVSKGFNSEVSGSLRPNGLKVPELREWKKKNPHRKPGGNTGNPRSSNSRPPISCYNCGKEGHISRECRGERRNQGRRGNGGYGGGQMADMAKSMAAMQEVLKKLVPEAVFP